MALVLPDFALGAVYSDLDSSPEALASALNEVVIGFDHVAGAVAGEAGRGGLEVAAAAVVNGNDDDGSDNPSVPSSVTPQGFWNAIPSSSMEYSATVGDTLTFKYGVMHNVFLAADETEWSRCSSAWSKCSLGSAQARLLSLLGAHLAAGSSALPGRGRPTGIPATASGARASRLPSRLFPCF